MDPAAAAGMAIVLNVFLWLAAILIAVAVLEWCFTALVSAFDNGSWVVKALLAIPIGLLAIPIVIINILYVIMLVVFGMQVASSARDWWHKGK